MSYRYIALVDAAAQACGVASSDVRRTLFEAGMEEYLVSNRIRLFTSATTPALHLSDGGLVIGHLFSKDGTPVTRADQIPALPSHQATRRYIIDNLWGDYVLFQPASRGADPTIMRDPGGGISCLYAFDRNGGFITSDISLAVDLNIYRKRIDWEFIAHRLRYPSLKTTRTGLADIRELLPGSTLSARGPEVTTQPEWTPWDFVAKGRRHTRLDDAANGVRGAVESVVKAWAKTDQTLLLELSGGLDSSIVGVCLRGTEARVACCTLVTPVPGADERQYAGQIASHLGVELDAQLLDFGSTRFDAKLDASFATPRVGALQHATDAIVQDALKRHRVNSFVSGGGGDSVFSYISTAAPAADAFREHGLRSGLRAIRDLAELHQCTVWRAGRLTLAKLMRRPPMPYREDPSLLAASPAAVVPEAHPWFDAPAGALHGDRERIFGLASTQVYRDSAPRGAKRHLRLPLLSQSVMEESLKAPCWMWNSGGRNRAVARLGFSDALPSDILYRRSKGSFANFLGIWYMQNKQRMRDFLLDGHLHANGILDAQKVSDFVAAELEPRSLTFTRIMDLCMVENWVRHQTS